MNKKDLIAELKDIAEYLDPPFPKSTNIVPSISCCLYKIKELIKKVARESGEFSEIPPSTKPSSHLVKPGRNPSIAKSKSRFVNCKK